MKQTCSYRRYQHWWKNQRERLVHQHHQEASLLPSRLLRHERTRLCCRSGVATGTLTAYAGSANESQIAWSPLSTTETNGTELRSATLDTAATTGSTPTLRDDHQADYISEVHQWMNSEGLSFTLILYPFTTNQSLFFALVSLEDSETISNSCNSTNTVLTLNLLPTPTRREECRPARLTQSLTDQTFVFDYPGAERSIIGQSTSSSDTLSSTSGSTGHCSDEGELVTIIAPNDLTKTIFSAPMIHLHQDIWANPHTGPIARARILNRCRGGSGKAGSGGVGKQHSRIFARQTVARRISQSIATAFLQEHHLWGATKTKYAFGLYYQPKKNKSKSIVTSGRSSNSNNTQPTVAAAAMADVVSEEVLVAVATFSSRRNVQRGSPSQQQTYRSHELIRTCSRRDGTVVGGISKLLAAFCTMYAVDDIVTVIDRDWGVGRTAWHKLGFETVTVMPPLPVVVRTSPSRAETDQEADDIHTLLHRRLHLVGAGIQPENDNVSSLISAVVEESPVCSRNARPSDRVGISACVRNELACASNYDEALQCLDRHSLYPIYDAGVERLVLDVSAQRRQREQARQGKQSDNNPPALLPAYSPSIADVWNSSIPTYAAHYYSDNPGIQFLLEQANCKYEYFC